MSIVAKSQESLLRMDKPMANVMQAYTTQDSFHPNKTETARRTLGKPGAAGTNSTYYTHRLHALVQDISSEKVPVVLPETSSENYFGEQAEVHQCLYSGLLFVTSAWGHLTIKCYGSLMCVHAPVIVTGMPAQVLMLMT